MVLTHAMRTNAVQAYLYLCDKLHVPAALPTGLVE
jgi:hypothetical protein